jgi:hypothetical protein
MNQPIEQFEVRGLTVKIYPDDCQDSPRDWDNLGTLVCFSREYNLGDGGYSNRAQVLRHVLESGALWLPVILHDYGSGRIKLELDTVEMVRQKLLINNLPEDASDNDIEEFWARNQCGLVFVESEKLVNEYGADNAETRETALKCLESEIETYNQFLEGDVYGYTIERAKHCKSCDSDSMEHVDSCWGFYGLDYCKKEAMDIAKQAAKESGRKAKTKRSRG